MSNFDSAGYNRLGQLFVAANNAATNHIAVTTAMTGLILYNPVGSGKKLIIVDFGFAWTTVPGAVHNIGLALDAVSTTAPTSATATTVTGGVRNADGSGLSSTSVAQAYSAATFAVAPVAARWSFGAAWGSSVGVSPFHLIDHIEGALIVVPGAALCTTVVTTTAAGMASFTWAEVPI